MNTQEYGMTVLISLTIDENQYQILKSYEPVGLPILITQSHESQRIYSGLVVAGLLFLDYKDSLLRLTHLGQSVVTCIQDLEHKNVN